MQPITVSTTINAPIEKVWQCWNEPEHITQWAFASPEWEAPTAKNDLRAGGRFDTLMAAKDKSAQFNFTGTYDTVREYELIEYTMDGEDARKVSVRFESDGTSTKVTETFDPENINPEAMQRGGWQAILESFKKHVESTR